MRLYKREITVFKDTQTIKSFFGVCFIFVRLNWILDLKIFIDLFRSKTSALANLEVDNSCYF